MAWLISGWIILIAAACLLFPNFSSGRLRWTQSGEIRQQEIAWPFAELRGVPVGAFEVELELYKSVLGPNCIAVAPDDYLDAILVNGRAVQDADWPIAYDPLGFKAVWVGSVLNTGANTVVFKMRNNGGNAGLRVGLHFLDPFFAIWSVIFISLSCVTSYLLLCRVAPGLGSYCSWAIILAIAIRILYFCCTPYYVRAHDLSGHLEYLAYVANKAELPPVSMGWETHQPPLYYWIAGVLVRCIGLNPGSAWAYGQWQCMSLLLSIASVFVTVDLSRALFRSESKQWARIVFLVVCNFVPASVFYAGRISNDSAFAFLSFVWLAALVRWLLDGEEAALWVHCAALAFALVCKNSAITLLSISAAVLLYKCVTRKPWLKASLILVGAIVLVGGWYLVPRMVEQGVSDGALLGNVHLINRALRIPIDADTFLTFNPMKVFEIPFNDPWTDLNRRQFFWEYFVKSALFGEWPWGVGLMPAARGLVCATLPLICLIAIGGLVGVKNISGWLMGLCLSAILAAQILLVVRHPLACCEDFRFYLVLTIPIAYFAGCAEQVAPGFVRLAALLFAVSSMGFIASLATS
jgi:hypothetical protein